MALHDDIYICPCPYGTTPDAVAAARSWLQALEPEKAVKEAYRADPTSDFMDQLSMAVFKDVKYRRSGLAPMFIHHIVNGKSSPERTRLHWEWPVKGLGIILLAIFQQQTQIDDAKIVAEIHASYPSIIDVVFRDISYLRQEGEIGDDRRTTVTSALERFMIDAEHKRTMYDQKTVELVLTCWLYASSDKAWPRCSTTLLTRTVFAKKDEYGNSPPPNCLDIAFGTFNANTFTSQINRCLKSKVLAGEPLSLEISAITSFLSHKSYHHHIVEARTHVQLLRSVRRLLLRSARGILPVKEGTASAGFELVPYVPVKQTDKGTLAPEDDMNIRYIVAESGQFVLELLTQSPDKNGLLLDLIQNTDMMEVGAAALRIMNRKCGCNIGSPWCWVFQMIGHIIFCTHPDVCTAWVNIVGFRSSSELVHALKRTLEPIARPMLLSLQSEEVVLPCGSPQAFIQIWKDLIEIMGITDESIRERYRAEKKCCNINCPSRKLELRLTRMEKKSICAGCHSVFYCSRECQRTDWKQYHKDECRKAIDSHPTHYISSEGNSTSDL